MPRYVIYDQFHWQQPNHLVVTVEGTEKECLAQYAFFKQAYLGESLGFLEEESFYKRFNELLKHETRNV